MRRITIAFAFFGALLAAACNTSGNREADLFCQVNLVFADEEGRAAFLERNADSIVRRTPHMMLSSHLTRPEIILASERDACPSDLDRAFGLRGVDEAADTARTATMRQIVINRSDEMANYQTWDQDHVRQCVARIERDISDEEFAVMERLVMSGLRDGQVHRTDDAAIFFSAEESCDLVERIARAALSTNSTTGELYLCPSSSHRACGDPAIFSNGTPSSDEMDALFDGEQTEGAK